jgi:hypothetical protein
MSSRSEEIDELFEKYYSLKEKKADIEDQLSDLKKDIEDLFNEFESDIIKSHKYTAKLNTISSSRINKKDLPQYIIDNYSTTTTTKTLQVYKTGEKPVRRSRSRSNRLSRQKNTNNRIYKRSSKNKIQEENEYKNENKKYTKYKYV